MKHIRIYLLLNHYKEKLQLSDEGVRHSIAANLGKNVSLEDLEMFNLSNEPSKKALANALKADGYKPKDISDMISETIYNTRYYLSNPNTHPYINQYWARKFGAPEADAFVGKKFLNTYSPPNLKWNTEE
jgi:hypothetical protein